jgi:hypothetical protein
MLLISCEYALEQCVCNQSAYMAQTNIWKHMDIHFTVVSCVSRIKQYLYGLGYYAVCLGNSGHQVANMNFHKYCFLLFPACSNIELR